MIKDIIAWILFVGITFALAVFVINYSHATYKPEFANHSDAIRDWFETAEVTKAAYPRLGWLRCCNHSDRVKTRFYVAPTSNGDVWSYEDPTTNKWIIIPDDVIHREGITPPKGHEDDPDFKQLQAEGVLFVYDGQVTCFWPPESGN